MLIAFFNHFKLSKKKAALAFTFFALLITSNCGKRKPPQPPIEKIQQRTEISGFQQGNKVILSWQMPARNESPKNILTINRIDVYRLLEPLSSSVSLSEEEFSSRSTLIASLPVTNSDFGLKRISYTDTLEFAGQPVRLRYAIRFVNSSGQKAAFSNFLLLEPTAAIANAPTGLEVKALKDSIRLAWKAPISNVDGTRPANILGYNVFRSTGDEQTQILNSAPVTREEFTDKNFEFEKKYTYFVRTVSVGSNGEPVESFNSDAVELFANDIFPPNPPEAVTIAAAPKNLSLFFAFNTESDVVGYKIHRSTDLNQPKSEWLILTPDLIKTNTFQDTNVESGKTYFYYVTAIDNAKNESAPSEIVSESAP